MDRHRPALPLLVVLALAAPLTGCRAAPSTRLTCAAADGDVTRVRRLVAEGHSPDERDDDGVSALAWAARHGRVATIVALVGAGADPNIRDRTENRWTPLAHAVHKHQVRAVDALLRLGAGPSAGPPSGFSPLIMAAAYGETDLVARLLDAGADPHAGLRNGENALAAAVGGVPDPDRFTLGRCQTDTVRLLVERVPDIRLANTLWARVDLWAARFGGCDEVLRLVEGRVFGRRPSAR